MAESKLKIPAPSIHIYKSNLEVLGKDVAAELLKHPETPVAVDSDVKVGGLSTPNYTVIVGFSSLHLVEALLQAKKQVDFILIIEPDWGVFHQTARRVDLRPLSDNPKIDIIAGIPPSELIPEIYRVMTQPDLKFGTRSVRAQNPTIIFDPFVYPQKDGVNHPVVVECIKAVADASKQIFTAMGCSADSHFRWERMWQNRETYKTGHKIKHLFNGFEDVPAIIVGGGPSVREFIDYAKANPDILDSNLIIACDATTRLLLSEGIRPHLVTRCERKLTQVMEGVDQYDRSGIFFVGYPWVHPDFFKLFDRSFVVFRDNGICKWTGYDFGSVNGGVSAANAAFELAYELGCKDIILSGVDCCFIDDKSHVAGTQVEFDIEKSRDKWSDIPGNNGQMVRTIPVWYRCLNEYNGTIGKFAEKGGKEVRVYNTSLKGAVIGSTIVKPWSELGEVLVKNGGVRDRIEKRLVKHTDAYHEKFEEKVKESKDYLVTVIKEFEKLFLSFQDAVITATREEEKQLGQLRCMIESTDFFNNLENVKKNLGTAWREPCRQIDEFKRKHFTNEMFRFLVLDMCQYDTISTENRSGQLENLMNYEHQRMKTYCILYLNLMNTLYYYCKKLHKMFETGKVEEEVEVSVPNELLL